MKIAIFLPGIAGGGTERFAVLLADGLSERGHDVRVLTGPNKTDEYALSEKVKRVVLYKKRSLFKQAFSLRNYLKANEVDFCVALGIYPNLIATLSKFFMKTKIILSERNAPKEDRLSSKSKILRFLLYRNADAYVFQTPDAKEFFSKSIQRRGIVIPNPIKEGLPLRNNNPRHEIVAVGRLEIQKNYFMLLDAFALVAAYYPNYVLRIFGKGSVERQLKSYSKQLGISDKVAFEGFSSDVHEQIKNSEIFVLPSDFEGLPNALMEAMAMGFPVVSTDCPCGGPRMLIINQENGLLVPVGNKEAMAKAICQFIESSDLREKCGKEAYKARNQYSLDKILNKWEDLFHNLIP